MLPHEDVVGTYPTEGSDLSRGTTSAQQQHLQKYDGVLLEQEAGVLDDLLAIAPFS